MVTVLVVPLGLWVNVKSMKKLGKIVMRLQSSMNDDDFVSAYELEREFGLHTENRHAEIGISKESNHVFAIYPNPDDELLGYDINSYSGSWIFDYIKERS